MPSRSDFEKAGPPPHYGSAELGAGVASLLKTFVVRNRLDPGDVVVAVRCGVGVGLPEAAKAVGRSGRVIGLETDPDLFQVAKANVRSTGLDNIQIRHWTPPRLPVADSSSAHVFLERVLGRSSHDGVCREAARILQPGGHAYAMDIVLTFADRGRPTGKQDHGLVARAGQGERELVNRFKKAGLRVISVGSRYVFDRQETRRLVAEVCALPVEQVGDRFTGTAWSVLVTAAKQPTACGDRGDGSDAFEPGASHASKPEATK